MAESVTRYNHELATVVAIREIESSLKNYELAVSAGTSSEYLAQLVNLIDEKYKAFKRVAKPINS